MSQSSLHQMHEAYLHYANIFILKAKLLAALVLRKGVTNSGWG